MYIDTVYTVNIHICIQSATSTAVGSVYLTSVFLYLQMLPQSKRDIWPDPCWASSLLPMNGSVNWSGNGPITGSVKELMNGSGNGQIIGYVNRSMNVPVNVP